jgi:hypothetical protein
VSSIINVKDVVMRFRGGNARHTLVERQAIGGALNMSGWTAMVVIESAARMIF